MSHAVANPPSPAGSGGRPRILFVNDLWGYGTVTMAMAVAEELQSKAYCQFAGTGPGYELARRGCFHDLLRIDTMADSIHPALDTAIRTADVVVDVMNDVVASRAAEFHIPCVYLDCLLWMWARPPAIPPGVLYLAERFPGVVARHQQWRDALPPGEVIGPLVVRSRNFRSEPATSALINFGGLTCSLVDQPTLVAYANTMARCSVEALGGTATRVIVAAGKHVLEFMDEDALRTINPNVELADLSHDAYLAELLRSRVLISSSGIHAMYEACAHGVPCVCLPPQNLSGSLALDELERAGVQRTLNWSDLDDVDDLDGLDSADQPDACRRIGECIHRFSVNQTAQQRLVQNLRDRLQLESISELRRKQAEFFADQDDLGVAAVVNRVLESLPAAVPTS
jgi:hypothetical protein